MGKPVSAAHEHKAADVHAEDPNHWSYTGPKTGPQNWSRLNAANTPCSEGKEQSPVNVSGAVGQQLAPLKFSYGMSKLAIVNNGHTIQVNIDPGSWLEALGERYELKQFHFHTPSEELISGKQFPLVAHMVHKSEAGQLAVVAVLFKEGKEHPLLQTHWERLPEEHGESRSYEERSFSPAGLLPGNLKYYTLTGSLTTPPCSEGVRWLILKTPVELSSAQLARFRREFPFNARPVQPINGREILESM
ncbi:carbonic anhydrase family protein [Chitinimonas arctica]|uniref:carbonic anhydrase n=2 Tax=Chitinimonas arctica TaxID=2594795 RepID=A0A516SLZ9_9NEIS|nr:carbonic anhydrase family protein [Chitinimonas arctica]